MCISDMAKARMAAWEGKYEDYGPCDLWLRGPRQFIIVHILVQALLMRIAKNCEISLAGLWLGGATLTA